MTSENVIDYLAELFSTRGLPKHIRSDNGPEFIAQSVQDWLGQLNVETLYIKPSIPWRNAYSESFNSRICGEFLALEVIEKLTPAKRLTTFYRRNYNEDRPDSSLGYQAPREFARHYLG